MNKAIPCSVIRGGTSKGLYLDEKDIPPKGKERDQLLLRLMGSPDMKQIDGLGGAQSVTSKIAIVAVSERDDADIDYTFAQVSIDKPIISYAGNCGNISSGVGPFAIESGMVKAEPDITTVRVFNTNTNKIIVEKVQTPNGKVTYEGNYSIAGVPGTSAPVKLIFLNPAASIFSSALPTGNSVDVLEVPDFGSIEASIVDVSNPLVFIKAKDVGMNGTEIPSDIDSNSDLLSLLEKIRAAAAVKLSLVDSIEEATTKSPTIPKLTIISEPTDYHNSYGELIKKDEIDLLSRMMSLQKAHPTYAMTGAMCTAAAAVIPNTIVNQLKSKDTSSQQLRIGHPGGILEAGVDFVETDSQIDIKSTYGYRTARLLIKGEAYC